LLSISLLSLSLLQLHSWGDSVVLGGSLVVVVVAGDSPFLGRSLIVVMVTGDSLFLGTSLVLDSLVLAAARDSLMVVVVVVDFVRPA
jgi:hypothetical protein